MREFIDALEEKYPGFNKKSLAYPQFERICEEEGITTWKARIPWLGWYFKIKGVSFIIVNRDIDETLQTLVAYHELGHYLLHPGTREFYDERFGWIRKIERQASVIAVIAVMPTPELLANADLDEDFLISEYHVPRKVARFRLKILDEWVEMSKR